MKSQVLTLKQQFYNHDWKGYCRNRRNVSTKEYKIGKVLMKIRRTFCVFCISALLLYIISLIYLDIFEVEMGFMHVYRRNHWKILLDSSESCK